MGLSPPSFSWPGLPRPSPNDFTSSEKLICPGRLDSWKEIGEYLGRGLSTVRRWEEDKGLPVPRVPGGARQAVFAYSDEIDQWLLHSNEEAVDGSPSHQNSKVLRMAARKSAAPVVEAAPEPQPRWPVPLVIKQRALPSHTVVLLLSAALAVVVGVSYYGWLARPLPAPQILRYTKLTSDGEMKLTPVVTDGIRLYFNEVTTAGLMICQVPTHSGDLLVAGWEVPPPDH